MGALRRLVAKLGPPPPAPALRDGFDTFAKVPGGFGNAIRFSKEEAPSGGEVWRINGHTSPRPRDGDRLVAEMQSGQWLALVIWDVEPWQGVDDGWSADAHPLDYVELEQAPSHPTALVKRGDFIW